MQPTISSVRVRPQIRALVGERSEVGAARRAALEFGGWLGFDATQTGKLGLCVTEAATNIVKHAGRGQILLRALERDGIAGVEILALDRGPGITNIGTSLRDGVSTAGSAGTGLGALARLSESFEIYAPPGRGTAVRLELWAHPVATAELEIGVICLPKAGESVSGDAWRGESRNDRHTFLVADGLGHGELAARASMAATGVLGARPEAAPADLIQACHRALAATRGAAVAVARLLPTEQQGSFAGVGNIAGRVETGESRRQLISHNGTLGHVLHRVQEIDFAFPAGALLILHSDGLATHWNMGDYPGLAAKHSGTIAGVLYRDHERGRDDVTVLVIRNGAILASEAAIREPP